MIHEITEEYSTSYNSNVNIETQNAVSTLDQYSDSLFCYTSKKAYFILKWETKGRR